MQITAVDFNSLSNTQLYDILKLRSDVFIIEQQAIYLDIDNLDQQAIHITMYDDNVLTGYARILPPNTRFKETSIGRLVISKMHRGNGSGRQLMQHSIEEATKQFATPIRIEAQTYLQKFYESLNFQPTGSHYIWDGVEHIEMMYE